MEPLYQAVFELLYSDHQFVHLMIIIIFIFSVIESLKYLWYRSSQLKAVFYANGTTSDSSLSYTGFDTVPF